MKALDIRIAEEYIRTGNGVQSVLFICPRKSYEAADKYFKRLSENVGFQNIINDAEANARRSLSITHLDLTKNLIEIKDRCMTAEPVLDKEGNPTGEWHFNANAAIKAIENLGKHIGYYKVNHDQKNNVEHDYSNLTNEEMGKLLYLLAKSKIKKR